MSFVVAPASCRRIFLPCLSASLLLLALSFGPFFLFAQQNSHAAPRSHDAFVSTLSEAALEQTHGTVRYDGSYVRIPYPGGDVPANIGVCTDVLIRAYRAVGIDLQKEVHEDIANNISAYPLRRYSSTPHTDTNIDHRRVPNLMVFFGRRGKSLAVTDQPKDYVPGDVVAWNLGGGVLHVGLVVNHKSPAGDRWMIVHNIGQGPKLEDVLFNWKIIGHYRYFGP